MNGSTWASISVCPVPFQERLGLSSGQPKSPGLTKPFNVILACLDFIFKSRANLAKRVMPFRNDSRTILSIITSSVHAQGRDQVADIVPEQRGIDAVGDPNILVHEVLGDCLVGLHVT